MEKVIELIKREKLFNRDDIVAVAVSGGRDSMALLHLLNENKEILNIDVVAINVDHCIRENSSIESGFVTDYCKENRIRVYNFKVDALKLSNDKKISIEAAAREARYGVFDAAIKKGLADKIAMGHHMSDQVETVLENLFRGSGLLGAKGMEIKRDEIYVRPFLFTTRDKINYYVKQNMIDYVDDDSNLDASYTRNFLRCEIVPALLERFKGLEKNIINFSLNAKEDNDFIESLVDYSGLVQSENMIKMPLSYFDNASSISSRVVRYCLKSLSKNVNNIEKKHIEIVTHFANEGANGQSISLPNSIKVHKEYEYLTITTRGGKKSKDMYAFKHGKLDILGYGLIKCNPSKLRVAKKGAHIIDVDKLPSDCVWRFRKEGDIIKPYNSIGTKKLKDYFIEKKVPLRLRDSMPVLASGNTIYILADIEISDIIKVTDSTENIFKISFVKHLI